MHQHPHYQRLLELSWRRKLTSSEEAALRACLAAHPELQADWELEIALSETLARLSDAPVPSNFTALVLQTVERDGAQGRTRTWRWRFLQGKPAWLPRVAFAGVLVAAGLLSYNAIRPRPVEQVAGGLRVVADVSSLPSPEALKDFDTIRALNASPGVDQELLALLQ